MASWDFVSQARLCGRGETYTVRRDNTGTAHGAVDGWRENSIFDVHRRRSAVVLAVLFLGYSSTAAH